MDGKRAKPDRTLAELAARRHGVVSVAQLRSLGISKDAVFARVRAGRLHRVYRGVYGVGHAALTNEGRWMAAVLAVARLPERGGGMALDNWGAAISHRDAACLWGLLKPKAGPVDLAIPGNGGSPSELRRAIRQANFLGLSIDEEARKERTDTPRTGAGSHSRTTVGASPTFGRGGWR